MTEVDKPTDDVATPSAQDVAIHRLGEWARSADAAYRVAERLAQSAFVPQQFRGKPVELTAAILAGQEIGLSPMAAIRSFDIIGGQAAPRAITQRAVAQSHGHEIVLVESTSTRCVMKGRRKGSEEWQRVAWTIDRARELGLTSKDNWRKQPAAMLVARATSELARLIAADAMLGIGYSAEEVADGSTGLLDDADSDAVDTPATGRTMRRPAPPVDPIDEAQARHPAGTKKAQRARRPLAAVPPPAPPLEQPPSPEMPPLPGEDGDQFKSEPENVNSAASDANPREQQPITKAQLQALHASFTDAGINGREDRLAYASSITGRDLDSSNELTRDEASGLISNLAVRTAAAADDAEEGDEPA